MSNHKKGFLRDKALVRLLETQTALDTEQIRLLLFRENSLRIVQRRLKILTERKLIKRGRLSIDSPFYYYLDKRPGQLDHTLGVSWIYTWVYSALSPSMSLHCFEREIDLGMIRPDAFIGVKSWPGKFSFFFAELDVDESGNNFAEKVRRYNSYYDSGAYRDQWWVPLAKRFPIIRVVTTGNVATLTKKISKANNNNLEFQVFSLHQVKEECQNGSSCSGGLRA
ncbi:replication-relaxation family protein [Desulfosporosinus sp. PR]|uniref:replication-relaxation family protein n=1 Tax=Candidatus Desulfosporosinus nitrosoreducens TaxID=3401928 RepID=UPI0027E7887C|nr:replication-relaxation family protein [Desulfosporosinus sp. PR]MDQ7094281.1 replication-relaxation family protein [Desulfosporosinus sp. PR]